MKICLYSPYVPKHFGGGEKYFFDVAIALSAQHQVTIAVPEHCHPDELVDWRKQYERFLDRSCEEISFVPAPLHTGSAWQKLIWTRQFDLCYAVTDGSMFLSGAAKNILHIQIPFIQPKNGLIERLKLRQWSIKNANSQFTQQRVAEAWRTSIQYVHYPAIDDACFQPVEQKQKIILTVGRFFRQLHSKRQDILVQAFEQLLTHHPDEMKDWKLVCVGTAEDQTYVQEVTKLAQHVPVEFYHHLDRQEVLRWYKSAALYWHAAGFEVNQELHPEKVEHFGISTAEAMAAGCIPLVVGKGGQIEVIGKPFQHLQWQTIAECVEKTLAVITHQNTWHTLQGQAQSQAKKFSAARFQNTLYEMIER